MNHPKKWIGLGLALGIFLIFAVAGLSQEKSPGAMPKVVVISTHSVGSMAYVFTSAIAEAVEAKVGIKSRALPSGTDVSKMIPVRSGEAHIVVFTTGSSWVVTRGAEDFATEAWGPYPLQIVWRGGDLYTALYTRGNSGIKKFSDIKGRRVGMVPGYPALNNNIKGGLAYAGLTLKDVTVVQLPSHGAAGKALTAGTIDVYVYGTTGADPMETASTPHGIYWIPFDPNDKEACNRFLENVPWVAIGPVARAAGMKPGDPPFVGLVSPYCYYAPEGMSEEMVYLYAKGIWDGYELYKTKTVDLPFWDHKSAVNTVGVYYPYHRGLVKLFKEKGVWTDELEKHQKQQLANQAERVALWKKFLQEAAGMKIKVGSEEFKNAWWERLREAKLLL
ncbi:MAG: TAXI family TRAP transporter solute-binding subunit [Deltaproteobacteria bacterium]|nr:TAXI family TRAP transporter solute-binding subunit [Deltaproteobacteria bacterium]